LVTTRTYDTIAADYCRKTRGDAEVLGWEEDYIRRLIEYIGKPNPVVLDVGCADGRHCLLIDRNGGKAVGIDLSDAMLLEARAHYAAGDYRKMDMRALAFGAGSFDGIWSSGSIYHVAKADVGTVIREFGRVLKPGGVVAVNFKLGTGEGMEENPRSYGGAPRYFAYYTKRELGGLFNDTGFEEVASCLYPREIFGDDIQQLWLRRTDKRRARGLLH
jgi:SAM-dependent methyltransferase